MSMTQNEGMKSSAAVLDLRLELIAEARRRFQGRWIPVAEEMPDADMAVLICCPDADEPVWIGWTDGELWRTTVGKRVEVSHWRPLPEPPEGIGGPTG
jgi:hypothetical protein